VGSSETDKRFTGYVWQYCGEGCAPNEARQSSTRLSPLSIYCEKTKR